jgi:aerobic C4-dicarboxylate transport protein
VAHEPSPVASSSEKLPLYRHLYLQVLFAIVVGALLGAVLPDFAKEMKPLGDVFIKLVKMMIAPIVFVTVVSGIARAGNLREVGRVGLKALVYFEVVSTAALAIGLLVGHLVRPGEGIHADPTKLDTSTIASYTSGTKALAPLDFVMHMLPDSFFGALASGEILQVLLISVLFGLALAHLGARGRALLDGIDQVAQALFGVIALIMRVAPIGAFGAMAFSVGAFGVGSLKSLALLMGSVYLTCLLFVVIVLGVIARLCGFSLWRLLRYLREELLIVLGTSSSEAALPRLMAKLENAGCSKSLVGLVVPTGYSFNLDGTSIYLTMAVIFIAQATDITLSLPEQLSILAVLILTSKGAATVTGGGFITLAATLAMTGKLPVAGLVLLLGVDRFMSEARALTNLVGNAVATIVIARWERAVDLDRMRLVLAAPRPEAQLQPGAG